MDYTELAKRLQANAQTCREEQHRVTDPRFIAELADNAREWDEAADAIEALTSPPDEAQVNAALDGYISADPELMQSRPTAFRIAAALNAAYRVRVKNEAKA